MNRTVRYLQPLAGDFGRYGMQPAHEPFTPGVSPEINRLLTAAIVNRRFCRLLLTNPIGALTLGYRGEAFHLNPTEVRRVSTIRATSLRDFALQLLVDTDLEDAALEDTDLKSADLGNADLEEPEEPIYHQERQEVTMFVR